MVDKPRLPVLTLDVQKDTTFVARPLRLTQGDKGYQQPFILTNAWQQYTVTAENLGFTALKPDGTMIQIHDEPARWSQADGVWYLNLPDELAQAIGDVSAYISVKDGDTVLASTTKFAYHVAPAFGESEQSNSYVSDLQILIDKFQAEVENAKNAANSMDKLDQQYSQQLANLLASLKDELDKWEKDTKSNIDSEISAKTDALQALVDKYNKQYNDLTASFNNAEQARESKLTQALEDFKSQGDQSLKSLSDRLEEINKSFSNIDLTQYLKKADAYTKQEIDDKVAQAGKVKTVNGKTPDDQGNITLDIPKPDLTAYATKQEIADQYISKQEIPNFARSSQLTDLSNTLASQIAELKATMPDVHAVSSESEGATYLQSHPSAIILVKGA